MVIVRAHFNVTTATATMPTTNNSATMSSRGSSNVRGGTRKIMAPTANAKEHTQRKVCVPSSFWAALLFAAGVLVQGGESATIVETKEWKACVAKKGGCTQIDVQRRGLTGTIPANICEVNPNLQRLILSVNKLSGSIPIGIGDCKKLKDLYIHTNQLTGTIPSTIGNCVDMDVLTLGANELEGAIPDGLFANCGKWTKVYLGNNKLTGPIPNTIGNCKSMTTLYLYDNNLSGSFPDSIRHCASLSNLRLENNDFSGDLPSGSTYNPGFWGKLGETLTTLHLQGNRFTGRIPDYLLLMGMVSNFPLTSLNVGDNLLSGAMPTHFRAWGGSLRKLTDKFTEIWLQGNDWDGGPCVALCGANAGQMDDAKRKSSKTWAAKCLALKDNENDDADDDPYSNLPATAFTVDELGRCTYKSDTCGKGQLYITRRTVADPDCRRCPLDTYQPTSGHKETECLAQTKCNAGEKIVGDEQDLRNVKRECESCTTGKYQSASNHRSTVCLDQTTCGAGQVINTDSTTERRKCSTCSTGKYQNATNHQEESCTDQPVCNPGESFENTVSSARKCVPCLANYYQDSASKDLPQAVCVEQPKCGKGQYITGSASSTTERRACKACEPGSYQESDSHRETECTKQPTCDLGEEFGIDTTAKRQCTACGSNEYQDSDDPAALQTVCIAQPTCRPGQFISPDSATSRRNCTVCERDYYQDENDHRNVNCKPQPTCGPGEKFTTSFTTKRTCQTCNVNQYQSSTDASALQTECIDQPFCAAGQYISPYSNSTRRTCSSCLNDGQGDTYQDQTEHREEKCTAQPKCQPGTFYTATEFAKSVCEACAVGKFQDAAQHAERQCKTQQACLAGSGFEGDATSPGECVICKAGTIQPKESHYDTCYVYVDPSALATVCNSTVGKRNDANGECECKDGFAGPTCSQFSNEKTCNGVGSVSYDAASDSASCSGCSVPALGIGEWCQFSNAVTCKNYGEVSADGVCTWDEEVDGTIAVSECKPGYYFNPNPETTSSFEDAISADANGCLPCSPGEYASDTARRVECDACPALQTSESASTSASDCFSKFERAPPDHTFCYGVGGTSGKPLSRVTSSADCRASAESLGFTFAGEFMVPYVGCVYDEKNQEARYYVDAASADGSRARHDNLICEAYVCNDPENDVTPLVKDTANPFDVDEFPSCRVSDAQTSADLETEKKKNREKFVPAMVSIGGATLAGSYYYQYRTNPNFDWQDIWMHIHVWLIFLRVIDMMSDFGFYAISLHGGAFLEKYGDGVPETTPYEEPAVAAFLFASVFFTTLGLFLMPLDIYVLGQRSAGDVLGMFSILIMVIITLVEDCPQIILVLIYMKTMEGTGATDAVAVLSLMASVVSVLFSGGAVFIHLNKLRKQNPTGWWRLNVFGSVEEVAKLQKEIEAFSKENAIVRKENASFRAAIKRSGSSVSHTVMSNPILAIDANDDSNDYLGVQEILETQLPTTDNSSKQQEEAFGGFESDADAVVEETLVATKGSNAIPETERSNEPANQSDGSATVVDSNVAASVPEESFGGFKEGSDRNINVQEESSTMLESKNEGTNAVKDAPAAMQIDQNDGGDLRMESLLEAADASGADGYLEVVNTSAPADGIDL